MKNVQIVDRSSLVSGLYRQLVLERPAIIAIEHAPRPVLSDCVASMYGDELHVLGLQNVARCLGWVVTNEQFFAKAKEERHEL